MNILIVEPPAVSKFGNQRIFGGNGSGKSNFRKPPLDLMMISGYLRKQGYDNTLYDANCSGRTIDNVKAVIKKISPDVIFFSTSTSTIYKDMLVAEVAKEINPSTITVAIGTHVMALPTETFELSDALDVIIYSGEWEQSSLNIIENFSSLEDAKGIYLRKSSGQITKTAPVSEIQDIDKLGFPSHDKLEKQLYGDPTSHRFPKTMVMGQKACINSCSFCCQPAFFGAPSLRKRSVKHVIEELEWVCQLGFKEVMFNDATLTADADWVNRLLKAMIEKDIDLTWNCSTRADCVNPQVLELMKKAGCHTIAIGMESTDPVILENIRKNVTPQQVKDAVSMIRKSGMNTIVFCVIGFPGETKETIKRTISFLKDLDTTFITLGIAVPAPGTEFYKYIEENGYLTTKDFSLYDPMKKPVFNYPDLSSAEMAYYSAYGLRNFYLRPTYIFKRLKSIRSIGDLYGYFINFIGFLRRYVIKNNG
ncbi:MAG: radical SAM protein [Planctomycetes bacterium]|nr:radical SAM protein [Planctomycetota bacterium]